MVEVIVPFAGSCEHRERALGHVVERAEWPVTVSAITGRWVKAKAVNPAVGSSSADIIVVADADCVTDGLPAAIKAVENGAPWAIPHRKVFRLTEQATRRYLDTGEWEDGPFDRRPYPGVAGGGFIVARRDVLHDVPLDQRFIGWGQEDSAWALALTCLHGRPWRGESHLVHLWHPPEKRRSRVKGSRENWNLFLRYRRSRRDPDTMRSILKEAA